MWYFPCVCSPLTIYLPHHLVLLQQEYQANANAFTRWMSKAIRPLQDNPSAQKKIVLQALRVCAYWVLCVVLLFAFVLFVLCHECLFCMFVCMSLTSPASAGIPFHGGTTKRGTEAIKRN